MASTLNFNSFSRVGWNLQRDWRGRWRWRYSYNATATGLDSRVLSTNTVTLNISATAIADDRTTGRATGIANSQIFFGGFFTIYDGERVIPTDDAICILLNLFGS